MRVVDRLRQPAYTGANRCVPCTVVNIAMAVALALAIQLAVVAAVGTAVGAAVASASAFVLSLASIYLRGYLVPGTPRLTTTYLPDWLLRRFDKAPDPRTSGPVLVAARDRTDGRAVATDGGRPPLEDFDVEEVLQDLTVVAEQEDGDLALTSHFQTTWREQIMVIRLDDESDDPASLAPDVATILDVDQEDVTVAEHDGAFEARIDGERVGQWISRAALVADAAAANALVKRRLEEWSEFTPAQRGALVQGMRVFLERCPVCDGDVAFGEETVESCCDSVDVVTLTCEDCGARILESEAGPA